MPGRHLSLIIPTLNEEASIELLITRLQRTFSDAGIIAELIFVDDHSTDATREVIERAAQQVGATLPIRCYLKQGKRGKAYSLIEGFEYARYEAIGFIDADLQYPPEALPGMLQKLETGHTDIVVANRSTQETSLLRRLLSRSFKSVFGSFLHSLDCDVQSGLKVFRRKILRDVKLDPTAWTFDLEFLLAARNYGYVIGTVEITFSERSAGQSKIHFLKALWEIGWNALKLRFKGRPPLLISPETEGSMVGAGVAHNRQRFITHTTLRHHISALDTFAPWQRNLGLTMLAAILVGLYIEPLKVGIAIIAILTAIYFIDTLFNLYLVGKSLKQPPELSSTEEERAALDPASLPIYSVLCPLYKEAHMLPTFVAAMEVLDWPKDKLDILLLLEENDPETVAAARAMNLPAYVRIVVVPHSAPKTKPKACNYGLSVARGEYVVIYDAEDIPDPAQLKKAYLGFQAAGEGVRCLQAKLNYFNPHQNLLTRLFTAEYSLWFDVILPGLQSIDTSIPLGGTSNHFRTRDLLELEGWDPFNVTEDCDLGVRIFKRGFRTAIIDSVTLEEANSDVKNWIRQRSRWIKGYMQTYLVHMRHPLTFLRENGWHALVFQLVVGGKIGFMFINPFLWLATILYFAAYTIVGPALEALYPPLVFYFGALSLVFGNFLYLYYYMVGSAKRGHYDVIKYVFLVPFYWLLVSWAAFIGLYQLIRKPHYWEKTVHGLHLAKPTKLDSASALPAAPAPEEIPVAPRQRPSLALSFASPKSWSLASLRALLIARLGKIMPHSWLEFLFSDKGFLMGALVTSNFINFFYNAYLGRVLSFENLALVTLINTFWFLAIVVIGSFSSTVNHRSAYLGAAQGWDEASAFLKKALRRGLEVSLAISVIWLCASPFLIRFFHVDSVVTLMCFTPVFTFGMLTAGYRGFLQGLCSFRLVGTLFVAESLFKLLLAVVLYSLGLPEWVYLSIPLSIILTAGAAYLAFRFITPQERAPGKSAKEQVFPKPFFAASLLVNLATVAFLSLDIILVNHYLEPTEAGEYALLALIGKMIYFLGSLPNAFTVTLVSRDDGLRKRSAKTFRLIYGLTFVTTLLGVLLLGVLGEITTPFLFGEKALAITQWLLPYTIALSFFTLTTVIVSYRLAKRDYSFAVINFIFSIGVAAGIVFRHGSIDEIVWTVFAVSLAGWLTIQLIHFLYKHFYFTGRTLRDFAEAFLGEFTVPAVAPGKKRILIFNWRDIKHSYGGGAEVYVHEIAKGWVQNGDHVTLFSGNDGKEKRHETIDGIRIIRRGGFFFVYVWAFVYYFVRFRGKFDIIIDCENGIPFFTPLYVREPVFCLLHHVHQSVFYHSLPRPFAWLASVLEKDLMPLVYRKVRFITVSESSRQEMEELGIGRAGISVANPGVNISELGDIRYEKSERPTVLYLGRLKAYKSVNILIQAFRKVLDEVPDAVLLIAGSGEERRHLERLTRELNMNEHQVRFLGAVSGTDKIRLLQSSWMLVNPSFMEGWGIVVIEANACGTPVIASDVPGLRDAVQDNDTGYLVEFGDVKAFAEKILAIIRDRKLRETLSSGARLWADNFDWEKTSRYFYSVISKKTL